MYKQIRQPWFWTVLYSRRLGFVFKNTNIGEFLARQDAVTECSSPYEESGNSETSASTTVDCSSVDSLARGNARKTARTRGSARSVHSDSTEKDATGRVVVGGFVGGAPSSGSLAWRSVSDMHSFLQTPSNTDDRATAQICSRRTCGTVPLSHTLSVPPLTELNALFGPVP